MQVRDAWRGHDEARGARDGREKRCGGRALPQRGERGDREHGDDRAEAPRPSGSFRQDGPWYNGRLDTST
jgi:hypothetical protein